ncbi:hypothetical protein ABKW28_21550 [Nocardioides sp. 31GB23]|uniref:hypothetical protein n=1 Tax=Nocardioides sp. 31GB23 TaxID=3156065 RepID=UPI0032AE9BF4
MDTRDLSFLLLAGGLPLMIVGLLGLVAWKSRYHATTQTPRSIFRALQSGDQPLPKVTLALYVAGIACVLSSLLLFVTT